MVSRRILCCPSGCHLWSPRSRGDTYVYVAWPEARYFPQHPVVGIWRRWGRPFTSGVMPTWNPFFLSMSFTQSNHITFIYLMDSPKASPTRLPESFSVKICLSPDPRLILLGKRMAVIQSGDSPQFRLDMESRLAKWAHFAAGWCRHVRTDVRLWVQGSL